VPTQQSDTTSTGNIAPSTKEGAAAEATLPVNEIAPVHSSRLRSMVGAALIASLMASVSWFAAYTQAVPFTLQTLFVILATLLLTPGWAAAAMALYLLIGVAGIPVFAGGLAGPGVLVGPTGGYLVGFAVGAFAGALVRWRLEGSGLGRQIVADVAGAVVALLVVYLMGTAWLSTVTGLGLGAAAIVGVVPFVVGDVLKAATAGMLARSVRRALPGGRP